MSPASPVGSRLEHVRLSIPATAVLDSWTGVDDAPRVEHTTMGGGSWIVETRVALDTFTPGADFHAGLSVRFGPHDLLCWGFYRGTHLQLDRWGRRGLIRGVFYDLPVVYLQIQKVGSTYTFLHRATPAARWIVDGHHVATAPVVSVGYIVKTWQAPSAVAADFDGWRLVSDSYGEEQGEQGRFDDPFAHQYTFGSVFKRYAPVIGPLLSLTARPGYHRIYLPGDRPFDHGPAVDDAPQLQRSDLGIGDWAIETELHAAIMPADGHAGLMVRFGRHDLLLWGLQGGGLLHSARTTVPRLATVPYSGRRVVLRIARSASDHTYTLSFAPAKDGPWSVACTVATAEPVESAGIMARTSSATPLIADFHYFKLTRVPLPAGDTGESWGHTSDFTGVIDAAWRLSLPTPGPAIGATETGGCARIAIPADRLYDDGDDGHHMPALLRDDMGGADWRVETKAILRAPRGAGVRSGLVVAFGPRERFLWGCTGRASLVLTCPPDVSGSEMVPYDQPVVYLRVARHGTAYTFSYKAPGDLTWTVAGTRSADREVRQAGLFSTTWDAPAAVVTDFDYLHLTRIDPFADALLDPAWTARGPGGGRCWSVGGEAGRLRLTLPANPADGSAPARDNGAVLYRGDMGAADWEVETRTTPAASPGAAFHAGLAIGFAEGDTLRWGLHDGGCLRAEPPPVGGGALSVATAATSVWVRIQRIGVYYLCSHRYADDDPWLFAGSVGPITTPVRWVGLFGETPASTGLTVDVDYVALTPVAGT